MCLGPLVLCGWFSGFVVWQTDWFSGVCLLVLCALLPGVLLVRGWYNIVLLRCVLAGCRVKMVVFWLVDFGVSVVSLCGDSRSFFLRGFRNRVFVSASFRVFLLGRICWCCGF